MDTMDTTSLCYLLGFWAAAILVLALQVQGFHSCLNLLGKTQEGASSQQGTGMLAMPFLNGFEVAEHFLGICSG